MKNTLLCFALLAIGASTLHGQQNPRLADTSVAATKVPDLTASPAEGWTERKITAVIFSTIIPGAGQSYLGHGTKGALFTVGAFGGGLVMLLSENNIVGRNERLAELTGLYYQAIKYDTAQYVWQQMNETKKILDDDVKRRDIFRTLTIAFWALNMLDVILFTDDRGEKVFTSLHLNKQATFALVPDRRNGINAALEIRF